MNFWDKILSDKVYSGQDVFFDRMKKAVDIIGVNAIVCFLTTSFYGAFVLKNATSWYLLTGVPFYLLSLLLNKHLKVVLALSVQFITSSIFLTIYSIRNGEESYTHVDFILMISGISLLYTRKETRIHFYLNAIFLVANIALVFAGFYLGWFSFLIDPMVDPSAQRHLNFLFLVICSIVFTSVIAITNKRQQEAMQQSIAEQRVLLAEVNHRVKNNLAIIVSLLNMQMNSAKSKETKNAIQVVHNRVMSMALVHLKMYENKNKSAIELEPYIKELVSEINNSISISQKIKFEYDLDPINLDVSSAIPMGLILNELITNAIKHAFSDLDSPEISISLKRVKDSLVELTVKDNGKGLTNSSEESEDGIGLSLIRSLAEQLDGTCLFENSNGMTFHMVIPNKG
jgi:two-component sensor histidine kinase